MATGGSHSQRARMYVYDLHYTVMKNLCEILDSDDSWEELGGSYLDFTVAELKRFCRAVYHGESPAHQMLIRYGQRNGTVDHLFIHLSRLKHYQAMQVLLPYVSQRVRPLYESGRGNTTSFLNGAYPKGSGWPIDPPSYPESVNTYQGSLPYFKSEQSSHKEPEEANVPSAYSINEELKSQCSEQNLKNYNSLHPNFNDGSSQESMRSKDMRMFTNNGNKNAKVECFNRNQSIKPDQTFKSQLSPKSILQNYNSSSEKKNNNLKQGNGQENYYERKDLTEKTVDTSVYLPGKPFPINDTSPKSSRTTKNVVNVSPSSRRSSKEENSPSQTDRRPSNEDNRIYQEGKPSIGENVKGNKSPNQLQKIIYPLNEPKRKISGISSKDSLSSHVLQIPFHEILAATNQFTSTILGQGGFGTVYRGEWKNMSVAIKMIRRNHNHSSKTKGEDPKLLQSLTELRTLDSCRHDNILPLYGFCLSDEGLCLVYQFMSNGSLEDRVQCRNKGKPLDWVQRCNILRGAACGIEYLHSLPDRPLIHGDIKSANILLDKNLEPKIGDFGLVSEGPEPDESARQVLQIHGTLPYLPPEYLKNHRLSTKVDSYSMGVVLFEVATASKAYDENRGRILLPKLLVDYVARYSEKNSLEKIRDHKAGNECSELFYFLITLGQQCTEVQKVKRPEMKQIIQEFDYQLKHIQKTRKKSGQTNPNHFAVEDKFPKKISSPLNVPKVVLHPDNGQQVNELAQLQPSPKANGTLQSPRAKSPVEQTTPLSVEMSSDKSTAALNKVPDACELLPPSYNAVIKSPKDYRLVEKVRQTTSPETSKNNENAKNAQQLEEVESTNLPDLSVFHHDYQEGDAVGNDSHENNYARNRLSNLPAVIPSDAAGDGMNVETRKGSSKPSLTAKGKQLMDLGMFSSKDS